LKKKQKQNISIGIIGILIIGSVIFYTYNTEQAKIRGFTFGNNLHTIQDELKQIQDTFDSKRIMFEEGNMSKEEFSEYSKKHVKEFEEIIIKYDELLTPKSFVPAVKLFKLSSETQFLSDKELIKWIETGDESARFRSDKILQESFEYEAAALALYNSAKGQNNP